MVETLFLCFPKEMVYTIEFYSLTLGLGDRPREDGCHSGGLPCAPNHYSRNSKH